jgi:hypothetical protein
MSRILAGWGLQTAIGPPTEPQASYDERQMAQGAVMDRPGCLGCVAGNCVVHAADAGRACQHCHGTGAIYMAKPGGNPDHRVVRAMCPICAGVGTVDSRRRTKRVQPEPVSERALMQLMDPKEP